MNDVIRPLWHDIEPLLPYSLRWRGTLPSSICELVDTRACLTPERLCMAYLQDGEYVSRQLTYGELRAEALEVAAHLRSVCAPGSRIMLMCQQGVEYITGFLGCLYAGMIAVPAFPPLMLGGVPKLRAMICDSGATFAITTREVLSELNDGILSKEPMLAALNWVCVDSMPEGRSALAPVVATDPAFIQYTSGSTSMPKGVVMAHHNVLHNLAAVQHAFRQGPAGVNICWAPMYHDMGLIGNALESIFCGIPCYLMSPFSFLQQPMRWLRAITEYRGTVSGGPNFAYDLCLKAAKDDDCEGIDLSSWDVAFNAAEPLRKDTIERFSRRFETFGLKRSALFAGYGLAESTVFVSGVAKGSEPNYMRLDRGALQRDEVQTVASNPDGEEESSVKVAVDCGFPRLGQEAIIVDADSRLKCAVGRIGQIWIRGPSIALGYWEKPEETAKTFGNGLASGGPQDYLATGDLGFLSAGGLYIVGRSKELVIIRGENYHPHDIEDSVEASHSALQTHAGAVFSVSSELAERLVVVQELKPRFRSVDLDEVVRAIRREVAHVHGLQIDELVLLRPGRIPKTTSGKIQRSVVRERFLADKLECVHRALQGGPSEVGQAAKAEPARAAGKVADRSSGVIDQWIRDRLVERGVEPDELLPQRPFLDYGLDSLATVELSGALEKFVGRSLNPTIFYNYPTLEKLSTHLSADPEHKPAIKVPRSRTAKSSDSDAVAVIGMGCRFPGASSVEEFWALLMGGRDTVGVVPQWRWPSSDYCDEHEAVAGKMRSSHGGFVSGVEMFDAGFFGVSPREADLMDPQQRMLMMVVQDAIDSAGIPTTELAGTKTGVFVGITAFDYALLQLNGPPLVDAYTGTGTGLCVAANRLSYFYGLTGPSLSLDTACSSSIVAMDAACRSIRSGESDAAIVGATNAILSPFYNVNFAKANVLAPDGRCKPFDHRADGYVRSEGFAALVLKPLARAEEDGDPIVGVVRSTAVRHGGRGNGLMAPVGALQEEVIREALSRAEIGAEAVQYVEAHGTGTALGDPIEAHALSAVLSEGYSPEHPCLIGSVKSNIGHSESAAGLAGTIKVLLAMQHGSIPATLHYQQANPLIDFDNLPVRVADRGLDWPACDGPRRAGVSSFGLGGTLSHAILEQAPAVVDADVIQPVAGPLVLSGHSDAALRARVQQFCERLSGTDESDYARIVYTAAARRTHYRHRVALSAKSSSEAQRLLKIWQKGEAGAAICEGKVIPGDHRRLIFIFAGQGGEWAEMGRVLLANAHFADEVAKVDEYVRAEGAFSVLDVLSAGPGAPALDRAEIVQPTLFAFQIGLAAVVRSWTRRPDCVLGQSMGEVAAAYVAGALSLKDATAVICRRSRLSARLRGQGGMLVVGLGAEKAQDAVQEYQGRVTIAVRSAPDECVVAGPVELLSSIEEKFTTQDVFCRRVSAEWASHSPAVDSVLPELARELAGLQPLTGECPMYSTVTDSYVDGLVLDAEYWCRNLREPVLLRESIAALAAEGPATFVEIGPHPVISQAVHRTLEASESTDCSVLSTIRRGEDVEACLMQAMAQLHVESHDLQWSNIFESRQLASLPSYPFQLRRHWFLPEDEYSKHQHTSAGDGQAGLTGGHPLLGRAADNPLHPDEVSYAGSLSLERLPYLADHRIHGEPVVPAAVYIEMFLEASQREFGGAEVRLQNIVFEHTLTLKAQTTTDVHTCLSRTSGGCDISIFGRSAADQDWVRLATASSALAGAEYLETEKVEPVGESMRTVSGDAFYEDAGQRGLEYGERFRAIKSIEVSRDGAEATIESHSLAANRSYNCHPTVLDACLQSLGGVLQAEVQGQTFLPVAIESLIVLRRPVGSLVARCGAIERGETRLRGDLTLESEDGGAALVLQGLTVQALASGDVEYRDAEELLYELHWERSQDAIGEVASGEGLRVLVFGDEGAMAQDCIQRCRGMGCDTIEVGAGEEFAQTGKDSFSINPERPGDFAALFAALDGRQPDRVLYLWSTKVPEDSRLSTESSELIAQLWLLPLLYLCQVLGEAGSTLSAQFGLQLVTMGANRIGSEAEVRSGAAVHHGFFRSLSQELPELRPQVLDLGVAEPGGTDSIVSMLLGGLEGHIEVATRQGHCWVPVLRSRPPRRTLELGVDKRVGAATGAQLVTGGMGGLGLVVADWLVERGCERLILMGRSAPGAAAQEAIEGWRNAGVRVELAFADVSKFGALQAAVRGAEAQVGGVTGMYHCAGVLSDASVSRQTRESFLGPLLPKCSGALHLHRLSLERSVEDFVLFSSATSVIGSAGQSNYAAANAFLDSLAHSRVAEGLPATSVDWGVWAEVGLATEDASRGERLSRGGMQGLSNAQGRAVLDLAARQRPVQLVAMSVDWSALSLANPLIADVPILRALVSAEEAVGTFPSDLWAELEALAAEERPGRVQRFLADQLAAVLRTPVTDVPQDVSMNRLGVDSLMAVELKRRIERCLGIAVPVISLLRGPSMSALAIELSTLVQERFAAEREAVRATELLEDIENLPEEEVERLLAELS